MKAPPRISEAEWQVMEVLWRKHPASANEVIEELGEVDWAANTVRTLLTRLVRKGALRTTEEGKKFLFSPVFPRDRHVANESQTFLQRLFGGMPKAMLLHFAESGKISEGDLAELRRILEERKRS